MRACVRACVRASVRACERARVGSDEKDAECSVFVYVINRVSLCSLFCIYFVDLNAFLLCASGSRSV